MAEALSPYPAELQPVDLLRRLSFSILFRPLLKFLHTDYRLSADCALPNKTECAYYFSVFIFANIVGAVGYFSQNQFSGRITVYPLIGVAMFFHELTGIMEYFYNCI